MFKVLKGKKKSTTKITVPSKGLTENWWRNKKLFRQAKVKRIQYHQTSFTTTVKPTYIVKKYERRKKMYKITPKQLENGIRKVYINNYFKCKLIKCSNQNTQTGWCFCHGLTKIRPIYVPANLENSVVATGLEKVNFRSNPKERQCQRMFKLPHNCTHLTC